MSSAEQGIDSVLKVEVSQDKIEARIVARDVCEAFDTQQVRRFLQEFGITEGISDEALERVSGLKKGEGIVVARGRAPEKTVQHRIDFFFPDSGEVHLEEQTDGTIDFREIGKFNNFEEGAILAMMTPGEEGKPGIDVFGKEIPAEKLAKAKLPIGKLVGATDDGLQAIAKASGHVCKVDGKITVLPKIQVPGDIDYSVGNIRFLGDVDVAGSVLAGFEVDAGGNLNIRGNVENAVIKSGKDLTINGVVFGRGDCRIHAGGNAAFLEIDSAKVDVLGSMKVKNAIRHSIVRCGIGIEVLSPNGVIVGGEIYALQKIKTANLGSHMGTLTKITVGTNPFVHKDIAEAERKVNALHAKLSQVKSHISTVQRKLGKEGTPPALKELFEKLQAANSALEKEISDTENHTSELRQKLVALEAASVEVTGTLFSGVYFRIRHAQARTFTEVRRVKAEDEAGEVKFNPL